MKRIKIITDNRVGITHDVLELVADYNLDINTMEVIPNQINLKLEKTPIVQLERLIDNLENIAGIFRIEKLKFLNYERREHRNNAVLNAVSEGIIAIDENGKITTLNTKAEEIIQFSSKEVIGCHIGDILNHDVPMLKTLKNGEGYDNKEIKIKTARGQSHYFTSGRPIKGKSEEIMGVVATLKDISEVRELYHTIRTPALITFDQIIYSSEVMSEVVSLAKRVAKTHSTIMLRGETGTGKELFARAIHSESLRKGQPFVPVNCAALPDTLLESELFGYEEGSFTGAKKEGKQGLFELANNGTIFLDEIGEISPHIQVKLLRVLQENKVRRIGGDEEVEIDVRVIAATNKDLEKMIKTKEFREDLYYRLNVIPIYIPPLRERKEDLPYLINHFLHDLSKELGVQVKNLAPHAKEKLLSYSWPGNVRELRNVLERSVSLASTTEIKPKDLLLNSDDSVPDIKNDEQTDNWELIGNEVKVKELKPLKELTTELEKVVLRKTYQKYKSSRKMGEVLGVSHTTILNKLKKYDIPSES